MTKISSNDNSHTSLTKKVKYHYPNEIRVVTLYGWCKNSACSNMPATSDFLDSVFAAHVTVGVLLKNSLAWVCFKVSAIQSNYSHCSSKPSHSQPNF